MLLMKPLRGDACHETWIIVSTNESTYTPAGRKHRQENAGVLDPVTIETQIGEYLDEDDIALSG
jgi:mannose-1-phosphate guanylyltransferase/mannose-6-phosphate isomerase